MTSAKDEAEQVKELTRELHTAIKEARAVKRELEKAYADSWGKIRDDIEDKIEAEVASGLNQMTDAINADVDTFVATIDKRLTTIIDTMLGENPKQKKRGDPSITALLTNLPVSAMQRRGLEELRSDWEKERGV